MRKIRDVLRLSAGGLSKRQIAASLGMSPTAAGDCIRRARQAGVAWPLPEDLDDTRLGARFYRPPAKVARDRRQQPDWAAIHRELRRKGVTLQLLWEEHRAACPEGYGYSRFCELYRAWEGLLSPTMRQTHVAGEKLFVDYAGTTLEVISGLTGEVLTVQLFVAVLSERLSLTINVRSGIQLHPRLRGDRLYAEATWTQGLGGETAQAWRVVLDDLIKRGLRRPEFLIVDGGSGLERALAELWSDVPTQRCTVHKHRNLLAHAPERLRDEVSADYNDMIYAASAADIEKKRKAFLRKWRLRRQAMADCLEEAGDRLFAFTKLPASQWKSARTTNAIERLHEEFKRRIKTQTVLPSAETAAMMFWALVASGQISMRKVDGWKTLAVKPADLPIDLAA